MSGEPYVCPSCDGEFAGPGECPDDGAPLEPTSDGRQLLVPGSVLTEPYEIVREIGRGAMGSVYEVIDKSLDAPFAAKVLLPHLSGDGSYVARLKREGKAAARIRHPNVVRVLRFDRTDDGNFFLLFELLKGSDLSDVFKARGQLPIDEAVTLTLAIADALEAAHAVDVIHRDLKPANIFLHEGAKGTEVRVLDFGIARLDVVGGGLRLTQTGVMIGTPLYMAPEAQETVNLDARADVYSLGVVLYEALAGEPPFSGQVQSDVFYHHRHTSPPKLTSKRNGLPRPLVEVVHRALAKSPGDRHPSMAEFSKALRAAVGASRLTLQEVLPAPLGGDEAVSTSRGNDDPSSPAHGVAVSLQGAPIAGRSLRSWAAVALVAVGIPALLIGYLTGGADPPPRSEGSSSAVVAPPLTAEPPPAMVSIKVNTVPMGADVLLGGRRLGKTPYSLQLPQGDAEQKLNLRFAGYKSQDIVVVPREDHAVIRDLVPVQPRATISPTSEAADVPAKPSAAPAELGTAAPTARPSKADRPAVPKKRRAPSKKKAAGGFGFVDRD